MINLYEQLNLESYAEMAAIKRAFRQLAKKYHPDVNPDPEANKLFQEKYAAYEILSDPRKKTLYDRLLKEHDYEPEEFMDDGYVEEWQQEAYQSASGYASMTYADFRLHKIVMHQWFRYPLLEWLMNGVVISLLLMSIYYFYLAFPYEGSRKQLDLKERAMGGTGVLILCCAFILIHTIRIQYNNYLIRKDEKLFF